MTTGLSNNSVLLFTGGGKGITAQCAIALSEQIPCTYVLMGRSQLTPEPEWATGVDEDASLKKKIVTSARANNEKLLPKDIERIFRRIKGSREIAQTLARIHDNGAKAFYVHADVTNIEEVKAALSAIQKKAGEITGVVHGAGRLADKRIERKTEDDFHAVFDTKVSGLTNVLESIALQKLNLLVLFSSVAGAFGNIGQSDYAMANEVLNKFAFRFQKEHPSCHTLSINWGPWDSGMVTPMLKKAFADAGIILISKKEGTQRFVDEVLKGRHPSPQIIIGSVIQRASDASIPENEMQVQRVLDPDKNPFLLDHQIGPNRVLPATCAASWMADTCEMLFPSYRFFRLENYRVFKGVVFSDEEVSEFITRVKVVDTSGIEEVRLKVRVASSSNEQETHHYQAEIVLKKNIPVTDKSINPEQWMKTKPLEAGHRYYDEKLLFHGPAFRGLKSVINVDEQSVKILCHLPDVPLETQGQFQVRATNPYLNDVSLQGLLVWSYQNFGAGALPTGIRRMEQFQKLQFGQDLFIDIQITSHNTTNVKANTCVYDRFGQLLVEFEGVEGTMSKALLPLFQESTTSQV